MNSQAGPDRRQVMAGLGAGAALAGLPGAAQAAADPAGRSLMEPLAYRDVTLLPGPAKAQFDATLEVLLAMDEAAMLRPFRMAAGQPVAAHGFGGWYDPSPSFDPARSMLGFIPGHSFGQYVSALSRGYAVSGDARAKAKVDRLVAAFVPTLGSDFFSDYPLPAYTYDKTLIGLLDAYRYAGNSAALKAIDPATAQVERYLPATAQDRQLVKAPPGRNEAFAWDESYTLAENLYLAAAHGAGDRYRTMARRYLLDSTYFGPLAAGRNVLPGRHAYSHMNALASAMQAYLTDGTAMHLAAARNGMDFILAQSFATGGWGPNEGFIEPGSGRLGQSLTTTHSSFEAPCGTYGHFKVARYLMRATGDSRYGDTMERLFFNAGLSALPLRPDGIAFYYADYNDVGAKTYYENACPCCSGSIGQLTADYGISAYLRDAKGLFVNLYLPSRAVWTGPGGEPALTLTQDGGYPLTNQVAMTVAAPRPVAMALRLRIPAWAGPGTRLLVNGAPVAGVVPGRFATVTREWRDGDRVALTLDRAVRLEPVDAQMPNRVAVIQGPLALFATGDRFPSFTRADLATLNQPTPGEALWQVRVDNRALPFKPTFAIGMEPTRLYQRLIV
jgi:hypothetical protein